LGVRLEFCTELRQSQVQGFPPFLVTYKTMYKTFWAYVRVPSGRRWTKLRKCRVFTLLGDVHNHVQNFLGVRLAVHFWGPVGISYKVSCSHKCRVFTLPGGVQNYVQNFLGVRQGSAGRPF